MKMLKILLLLPLFLLSSCVKTTNFTILENYVAYQTSDYQEYTHDLRVARVSDDIFVEIPYEYSKDYVNLEKTDNITYFRVYGIENKVSDKGYKFING